MQDPEFDRGVWAIIHHGMRTLVGRISNEEPFNHERHFNFARDVLGETSVLLKDAVELEQVSVPIQDRAGNVGVQHRTLMRPVGAAECPTDLYVRGERVQFIDQLDKDTAQKYKTMYETLLKDLRAHRAASVGIQIVEEPLGFRKT